MKIIPSIAKTLAYIVNVSLEKGIFVTRWKTVIIQPLQRKTSNLVFLSKALKKVLLEQFTAYYDEFKMMPDYQSAYRRSYSCRTSLVKVVNDILCCMERQKVCAVCIIDFSTAFDMVSHQILLDVLGVKFEVKDMALSSFSTYLRPRSCKVNVEDRY